MQLSVISRAEIDQRNATERDRRAEIDQRKAQGLSA